MFPIRDHNPSNRTPYVTWALIVVNGLAVLGSAAFHPSGVSIVSACGTKRRGTATSIFSLGGSLGTALSPLLVTWGVAQIGLRGTLFVIHHPRERRIQIDRGLVRAPVDDRLQDPYRLRLAKAG